MLPMARRKTHTVYCRSRLPLFGFRFGSFVLRRWVANRWSCGNITLLGDACHPATPNNGQGACMAIEDALVLATLLAEHWEKPDGHVEAFYLYEVSQVYSCCCRWPYSSVCYCPICRYTELDHSCVV